MQCNWTLGTSIFCSSIMKGLRCCSIPISIVLLLLVVKLSNTAEIVPRLNCNLNDVTALNEAECHRRGCRWNSTPAPPHSLEPQCWLDPAKVNYHLKSAPVLTSDGIEASLVVNAEAHHSLPFAPLAELKLDVQYLGDHMVRVRLTDPSHERYEVPVHINPAFSIPKKSSLTNSAQYNVSLNHEGNLQLVISRKGHGSTRLFDTSLGGLIFGDRFLQITTRLASEDMYGLGERFRYQFKSQFSNYTTYPLFTHDFAYFGNVDRESYGVHPFYTVLEADGKAHGVFLLNSNAMAYTLLPGPGLSIKSIGGVLDLFIFVGDNPEHVVQLYSSVVGRSVLPAFWALGFQLCRFHYHNTSHVERVVKRNLDNHVPLDVKYVDLDYADNWKIFTLNQAKFGTLPALVNRTKREHHLHWAFIVDPGVAGNDPHYTTFTEGYARDVFVKWSDSVPAEKRNTASSHGAPTDRGVIYSKVWANAPWAFPDFFKNATRAWWEEQLKHWHDHVLPFDALWIDMNEPATMGAAKFLQCPQESGLDRPLPSQRLLDHLSHNTLCMDAVQGEHGELRHYDVHSLYGWSETIPTSKALQAATGKRGFLLSRSTYAGSGHYTGHWLGDNNANWVDLRQSIVGILEFNLYAVSLVGVDICGFNGHTTPELCRRWFQLGAYYPFSRDHNQDSHDQDPGYFVEIGHPEVTHAMVSAYTTRYQLLHYLYTLFYRSSQFGDTVARPMHHEFPKDVRSRLVQEQFFLGKSVLVCPFLYPSQKVVEAYVPQGSSGQWFRIAGDFVEVAPINSKGHISIPDSDSDHPLLLRAGSILPVVGPKQVPRPLNAYYIRQVPIELWVLLDSSNGTSTASGELFFDDGESVATVEHGQYNHYSFHFSNCRLVIEANHVGYNGKESLRVNSINIASSVKLPDTTRLKTTLNPGNHELKHSISADHHSVIVPTTDLNLSNLKAKETITLDLHNSDGKCPFGGN